MDHFRKAYRQLTEDEIANVSTLKEMADVLYAKLDTFPQSRETSLAKTKLEEAVMWAVKGITG